jgi:hypothetical protein
MNQAIQKYYSYCIFSYNTTGSVNESQWKTINYLLHSDNIPYNLPSSFREEDDCCWHMTTDDGVSPFDIDSSPWAIGSGELKNEWKIDTRSGTFVSTIDHFEWKKKQQQTNETVSTLHTNEVSELSSKYISPCGMKCEKFSSANKLFRVTYLVLHFQ